MVPVESIALILSMITSILTLLLLIIQTRSLAQQTKSVARNLEYAASLKLVDSLNEVNLALMLDHKLQEIFRDVRYIADGIDNGEGLSMAKVALAWHHFNRYEAAFMGFKQGMLPSNQWLLWKRRVRLDMQAKVLRSAWRVEREGYAYDPEFLEFMEDAFNQSD